MSFSLDAEFDHVSWWLKANFPKVQLTPKDAHLRMYIIAGVLWVITLGKMKTFMSDFTTTLGAGIYLPTRWSEFEPAKRLIILRHECIHLRQRAWHGWRFGFLYLFSSWWRTHFEQEAYEESIKVSWALGYAVHTDAYRDAMIRHFTSAEYFWMCRDRKKVEDWFDAVVAGLGPRELDAQPPLSP